MKKFSIAFVMLCMFAGAVFAQSADLQVLAIVKLTKNESITVKQLKTRVNSYEKQMGRALTVDDKKKVLDSLIDEKVMLQAATKAGISIPDSAVDQYFIQSMSQQLGVNVTEKELADLVQRTQGVSLDTLLLQQVGMNIADYKAYLKAQLVIQQYVVSQKQGELQKVIPTDEEIKFFYESNKASFVQNDMMKIFLVIVPKGNNPDEAKLKLNDLKNKFQDKKLSMEQMFTQSNIAGSGYQAGELLLPKTNEAAMSLGMPYQNMLVLFNQSEGFISDIQETPTDFRFVSVGKKYSAKMLALMDLVQPETNITVYDYIRTNLAQQKQMQFVQLAAVELAKDINTPENVERKKTGEALDKLLAWGE